MLMLSESLDARRCSKKNVVRPNEPDDWRKKLHWPHQKTRAVFYKEERMQVTMNGRAYAVEPDQTILQAALANGLYIPSLCYHE